MICRSITKTEEETLHQTCQHIGPPIYLQSKMGVVGVYGDFQLRKVNMSSTHVCARVTDDVDASVRAFVMLRGLLYLFENNEPRIFFSFPFFFLSADTPMGDPVIYNIQSRYSVGDLLNINCSSFESRPAAQLAWFINGQQPVITGQSARRVTQQ